MNPDSAETLFLCLAKPRSRGDEPETGQTLILCQRKTPLTRG